MEDKNTQLELKGVVFNEMKGAMGSQAARFNRALGATLFPTSTYHHNSGGDPVSIPTLTHEDLTRFHATHYHPSNARVFTYGDLPLEATLAKSQELALGKFDRIDVSALDVADERRLTAPVKVEVPVPADPVVPDPNKQSVVSVAYLMVNQIKEKEAELENFALTVASDLLLNGPQAYFHETLLESGLGSGFAPGTGYSSSRRETSFAVGLKGVAEADVPEVEAKIQGTLETIAKEGFPKERVDAVMHQVELGAGARQHQLWPGRGFRRDGDVGARRRRHGAPQDPGAGRQTPALRSTPTPSTGRSSSSVDSCDNSHRVTVVGVADKDYDAKLEAAEKKKVAEIEGVPHRGTEGRHRQGGGGAAREPGRRPERGYPPTLKVSDAVPREIKHWNSSITKTSGGFDLQIDAQPTNGITFANLLLDVSDLPDRLVPYLDLFAYFITELGTKTMDYKALAREEKLKTGGIGASVDVQQSLDASAPPRVYLSLSGSALDRNVPAMFRLMATSRRGAKWVGEDARLGLLLSRRARRGRGRLTERTLLRQGPRERLHRPGRRAGLPHRGLARTSRCSRGWRGKRRLASRCPPPSPKSPPFALARNRVMRCRISAKPEACDPAVKQMEAFIDALPLRGADAVGDELTLAQSLASFAGRAVQDFRGDAHADQLLRRVLLDRALLPPGLRAALPARPGHVHLVPPQGDQGEGRRVRWRSVRGSRRGSLRALLLPRPQHHSPRWKPSRRLPRGRRRRVTSRRRSWRRRGSRRSRRSTRRSRPSPAVPRSSPT